MNILIVDDSKTMRCLLTRTLRDMGLREGTFLEASDGKQALQLIQKAAPDLIISDFNMKGMSGMELLLTLKTKRIGTHFGFVTSEASPQLHEEAKKAGALFVATKPFTPTSLSTAIKPILTGLGFGILSTEAAAPLGAKPRATFADYVAHMLAELLRRDVTAAPIAMLPLPPRGVYVIAEYARVTDNAVIACAIFDVPSAVAVGGAFSLIPLPAVAEAIAARRVAGPVAENLREVLNVMSRLFGRAAGSRVCLAQVHMPGEPYSAKLGAWVTKPKARIDVRLEIAGYGKGNLTLLSC